ncbi:discoidin domain-containing protein [Actinomadura rugatobispora]|uniref:Discoidin domain-containing protein n=1 Tax=Actinomadura rugatobispora TaxID=1994 RepID=A0ABW1ADC8_9ACTN|nr:discoidin domain-containing protein [Actinomadura rugatobispora]
MRRGLGTLAFACAAAVLVNLGAAAPATARPGRGPGGRLAAVYNRALLLNTPVADSAWDGRIGSYRLDDFRHVAVFGNAVLLEYGVYDPAIAGVTAATLRDHTLRTIEYAAARNRWIDPAGTWGRTVYWDSTMETYFVAAAKMLWSGLTSATRSRIDRIIRSAADAIVAAGDTDPHTNGLRGGYRGDTKMEEMGARTMPLATALAWLPDDPNAASWREWLTRWTANMGGLPPADRANPAPLNGRPVSAWNRAHNVWGTFIVENHGSYNPIYQQSMGAYPGRNAAQFLLADRSVPEELVTPPNDDPLWATMAQTGMDSGVPQDFMVADRHHLYGRQLLPVTARAVLDRDRYAAAAETMLADRLIPYVRYPPGGRLTKFSGEGKYEPEARAEVGMAYLLHRLAGGAVRPVSPRRYFERYTTAVDHGPGVGLLAHQSANALAAAVTKPGYVKFAYHPQHDDWLFDSAGTSPSFLPSTAVPVTARRARAYTRPRDGFTGAASALTVPGGVVGFTTLPDGSAVYASSGVAAGEGVLRLYNMTMPGVPGLDGDRTFTWAGGSVTLPAPDGGTGADELRLRTAAARYVRVRAAAPGSQGCCALDEFEIYAGTGANRARGRPVTVSAPDPRAPAHRVTDGDTAPRPAPVPDSGVPPPPRTRPRSITVDLGDRLPVDRVRLHWGHARPARYTVETSPDGRTWRRAARTPVTRRVPGGWLNVDGRAGLVVRTGRNPISVSPTGVTLSDGPATPLTVEAHPAEAPRRTASRSASPAPRTDCAGLVASLAGGQLSLFNLGAAAVTGATAVLPQGAREAILYQGVQRTGPGRSTRYDLALRAADARIAPARFAAYGPGGGAPPAGLTLKVIDSRAVEVANAPGAKPARVRLRSLTTGETVNVRVARGTTKRAAFTRGPRLPTTDLARGRITYPTSPRPPGMTDPARAVDGARRTAWSPGPAGGRMVVDLGAVRRIGSVLPIWAPGRAPRVEVSRDGKAYAPLRRDRPVEARYVAVVATGPGKLSELAVLPSPARRSAIR